LTRSIERQEQFWDILWPLEQLMVQCINSSKANLVLAKVSMPSSGVVSLPHCITGSLLHQDGVESFIAFMHFCHMLAVFL
jgi:hypothetical protein